jgi:DNA-binding GntR family transcriptional regulator
MTIRLALARLVHDGLITRHRGRGSFVAEPRREHPKMFLSFEEEMRAQGASPGIKLLAMRTEPAEGKVAENLALTEGTPVSVLERLRLVDGQVVGYEIRYLPQPIGAGLTPDEIENQPLVPPCSAWGSRARGACAAASAARAKPGSWGSRSGRGLGRDLALR